MLGLIYVNALNTVVKENRITNPLEIIAAVNKMAEESLNDSDRMDISLCVLHEKTGLLRWSGSENSF